MTAFPSVRRTSLSNPAPLLIQAAAALTGGFVLFLVLALLSMLAFDFYYAGKIYPGVSVAGIDLSGMRPADAALALSQRLSYPQSGKIALQDGEQVWAAKPADLGLSLDGLENGLVAYNYGRTGNPITQGMDKFVAWYAGKNLAPVLVYDKRIAHLYLSKLAAQLNRPVLEASLKVNGVNVEVLPGQVGRQVDIEATLIPLEAQLRSQTDGLIPLVVQESTPAILDASQQAEVVRQLLSAPLTLQIPDAQPTDPGPWVIPPENLAAMLTIERVQAPEGWTYQVKLSNQALYSYLNALVANTDRQPADARFIFNDETHLLEAIQPSVTGRNLDIYTTIQEINQKLSQGQHNVALSIKFVQPGIADTATGEQLGIRELVGSYTSYFRGSSQERLQNIKIAAANFHGLLVPPGAVFSMSDSMGSVSLDNGYAEAWIIIGGRTIKGVGGGVCQVSTTLFRTAFFAGYPILLRYPHAYRVSYYEQTRTGANENLAGLDATVFVPVVDFKFQNDTPNWLLMETYFNASARSLTWKFYSTSDGRTVDWETSGPQNIVDPPDPVYEENPELDKGEIRQVDWAAQGADVTVVRTVNRDGQVYFSDTFTTHYLPWGDVFQYGPGTELPGTPFNKKKNKNPAALFDIWKPYPDG